MSSFPSVLAGPYSTATAANLETQPPQLGFQTTYYTFALRALSDLGQLCG